jgi:hypothetical protein
MYKRESKKILFIFILPSSVNGCSAHGIMVSIAAFQVQKVGQTRPRIEPVLSKYLITP